MRLVLTSTALACTLGILSLPQASRAGNYTTTVTQGAGQNWNGAIWSLDGTGTAVAPSAGNTYECLFNGTSFGNATANTRIRNPATAGLQTFPGDSLTLSTNTEIRMKQAGAILNFPGVGGNPGLILDGGILNIGDDAVFVVTGKVQVASESYIAPGDNGGGGVKPLRAVTMDALLSGAGNMVIFQAATNLPQRFTNPSNTFSGGWVVKAGLLQGTRENSLGTNNITIDPYFTLPLDTSIQDIPGPAVFEPNYDINSAGVLTLVNGGLMRLHQNCAFTAVSIEGTLLSPGTHYYTDLLATYPNTFEPGGAGAITVQPFGTLPALKPQIATQPLPQMVYAGRTVRFTVAATGSPTLSYQWRKDGVNLTDGASISGSTTPVLTLSNVAAGDAGTYTVEVSNAGGNVVSAGAALTLATPTGEAYETAVIAASPAAYYRLNETADPATGALAFDFAGGHAGSYGTGVQNGNAKYNIAGPQSSGGWPGFAADNKAALFVNGTGSARITVEPWNLNTNTVTLTAWIKPEATHVASEGIVFCRGNGTVAGLNYSGATDASGNYLLGYHWNDEPDTYNWNSGLAVPAGQWSFVALSVNPTQAVIYLMNTNGVVSSTHVYPHVVQAFGGVTTIGDDNNDGGDGTRVFNGTIDEVAVFGTALAQTELMALYSAGSGVALFAPTIGVQPASQSLYAGQTAQLTVGASGTATLSYQWRVGSAGVYTDVKDDARISGAKTPTLVINNLVAADAADYIVVIQNGVGTATSTVATLTVLPTSPAEHITMSDQEPGDGSDWNTGAYWSDGLPASESAAAKPGSTYEVLPGARLRTPTSTTVATFPGDSLTIDGDGVWVNNPAAGTTSIAEIRFKQPASGTVIFKKLIMNGGQLDSGNDGVVTIGGEIEIRTNTPIYNDNANDRGYRITAQLTGSSSIEYHGYNLTGFMPNYVNNLEIAGTSNTFSGTWNVVLGTLLGTAPGALGTNDITVGANGALETTYDIDNLSGSLILNGRMYLHQNDRFRSVTVAGTKLADGLYSFTQLNAAYPSNFPLSWTPQTGATTFTNASGSITVGNAQTPPTVTLHFEFSGSLLKLTWSQGTLFEADELTGPWTANSAPSPYSVSPTGPKKFYRVKVQ